MIDDLKKLTKRLKQARKAARELVEIPNYAGIYLGDDRATKLMRMVEEIHLAIKPLQPVVADEQFFKAEKPKSKSKRRGVA